MKVYEFLCLYRDVFTTMVKNGISQDDVVLSASSVMVMVLIVEIDTMIELIAMLGSLIAGITHSKRTERIYFLITNYSIITMEKRTITPGILSRGNG